MRAAYFYGPGDIRIDDVPWPTVTDSKDAVVRVLKSCICGSDLWYFRGLSEFPQQRPIGHEFVGIVESVGKDVTTLHEGDVVIAPWAISCGICKYCKVGLLTSCEIGGYWGKDNDGGQAEAVRVPLADSTLVKVPSEVAEDQHLQTCMLTLSDVMGTGHHADVLAGVREGGTTIVIGDGAVGLCAVLAARKLGSEQVIAVGRHEDRLKIAEQFGATSLILDSADTRDQLIELTKGGAESVCECVGTQSSIELSIEVARPGGAVGFVGVPHLSGGLIVDRAFEHNISLNFGVAPVRNYIAEYSAEILAGRIDPSPVFDCTITIDDIDEGYRAMDERRAIKTMIDF